MTDEVDKLTAKVGESHRRISQLQYALRDLTAAIVVARLKEAVEDCKSFNRHPGDKAYNKKFSAAAKIVIKHFGG